MTLPPLHPSALSPDARTAAPVSTSPFVRAAKAWSRGGDHIERVRV